MAMRDYIDNELHIGDLVLENRGHVYEITDDDLQAEGLAHGVEVTPVGNRVRRKKAVVTLRLYHMFKVNAQDVCRLKWHNEQLYNRLYADHDVSAKNRAALLARKAHVDAERRRLDKL